MSNHDLGGDGFSAAAEAEPGLGHNQGPSAALLLGDLLVARLHTSHAALFERAEKLRQAVARMPRDSDGNVAVTDADTLEKATDMVRLIQGAAKALNAQRMTEKEPYRLGGEQVDSTFSKIIDALDPTARNAKGSGLKQVILLAMNIYNDQVREAEQAERNRLAEIARKEEEAARQRIAEEEAAKQAEANRLAEIARVAAEKARGPVTKARAADLAAAAETAQAQVGAATEAAAPALDKLAETRAKVEEHAAAPAADLTRARGSVGVSSQQEFVDFRDITRDSLDLESLRQHLPTAALEVAVRAWIKANNERAKDEIKNRRQPLRGVVLFMNSRTRVS